MNESAPDRLPCMACNQQYSANTWHDCPVNTRSFTFGTYITPDHLCPDLLRYEQIGAAANLRGRVVRAFFWAMKLWPVKP